MHRMPAKTVEIIKSRENMINIHSEIVISCKHRNEIPFMGFGYQLFWKETTKYRTVKKPKKINENNNKSSEKLRQRIVLIKSFNVVHGMATEHLLGGESIEKSHILTEIE